MYVYVETQQANTGDKPPRIWYWLCEKALSECKMDEKIKDPASISWLKEITDGAKVGTGGLQITVNHKGSFCTTNDASKCHYVFVLQNTNSATKTTSMMVQGKI